MTEQRAWLTIAQAAKRAELPGWKMRRRLHRLNQLADGRLLKHTSKTDKVRKWWVSAAVLDELLAAKRIERTGTTLEQELDELSNGIEAVHERLTVLDNRTAAQTRRLARHGEHLKRHDEELADHAEVLGGLTMSATGLHTAVSKMAKVATK